MFRIFKLRKKKTKEVKSHIERNTTCDNCEHLQTCILSENVLDCTTNYDTKRHYIKGLGCKCIRDNELRLETLRLLAKEIGYKLVKETEG